MTNRTALQIGDVAGVGADLSRAINDTVDGWEVRTMPTSQVAASKHGIQRLAMVPGRMISTIWRARREIQRLKPDVVHMHGARWAPILIGVGSPTVIHAHGTDVRGRRNTAMGRFILLALRRASLIVAATPDLLEDLPDGARVLANPVDTDTFQPGAGPVQSAPTTITAFAFARLSEIKGATEIVKAAEKICAESDVRVVALAGGPFDDQARSVGVEILPALDRDGIVHQLQTSHMVIGQQRLGVLGRSEYEAMSAGLPVIMRLDEHRYPSELPPVIAADNPTEIATHVKALAEDPARRALIGAQSRAFVEATCGLAATAATMTSWYEELQ